MEKVLNEISLLWNNVGLFYNFNKLFTYNQYNDDKEEDKSETDQDYVTSADATSSIDPEELNGIEDIKNKWKIIVENMKFDEMIKLHENVLSNLSELTIREIFLHSNFKNLNDNYNNLLNTQFLLNMKIKKMEMIYKFYNNINLVTNFNNSFTNSTDPVFTDHKGLEDKLKKLNEMLVLILSSIDFFNENKLHYKAEVYRTKYEQQYQLFMINLKFFIKIIFTHFSTTNSVEHGSGSERVIVERINIYKLINAILVNIKESECLIQIKLYFINSIIMPVTQVINEVMSKSNSSTPANRNQSESTQKKSDSDNSLSGSLERLKVVVLYYKLLFDNTGVDDDVLDILRTNLKNSEILNSLNEL